jgi:hypothetical protein
MTPSKLWYAQKLAELKNDGSKPEDLAEQMTIRRLCYEIEKLEELQAAAEAEAEAEAPAPVPVPEEEVPEVQNEKKKPKSFWARVALDTSSDEDE